MIEPEKPNYDVEKFYKEHIEGVCEEVAQILDRSHYLKTNLTYPLTDEQKEEIVQLHCFIKTIGAFLSEQSSDLFSEEWDLGDIMDRQKIKEIDLDINFEPIEENR